jgi:monovalent cation/hydrogen antiporter
LSEVLSADPASAGTPLRRFPSEYERLSHLALDQERRTIIQLRNQDVINDEVLRRIQRDIDLAEARLLSHR